MARALVALGLVLAAAVPPGGPTTPRRRPPRGWRALERRKTEKALRARDPAAAAPRDPAAAYTVGLCVCLKDAEAYLVEWLDFHLAAGFDAIYLYDNSPTFELERFRNRTRGDPWYSRVEVLPWVPRRAHGVQVFAYDDCVRNFGQAGPRHAYMALLDIDEFLVLQQPEKHRTIKGVLDEYLVPFGGALVVNWMLFGSANKSAYAPVPVTKRFQYREPEAQPVVKTIVASDDYRTMVGPHACALRDGAATRDTSAPGARSDATHGGKAAVQRNARRPAGVVLLYHYRYMSEKEHLSKMCRRGRLVGGVDRFCNATTMTLRAGLVRHIYPTVGTVRDDSAWRFLVDRVPRYRAYDDPGWTDYF